MNEPRVRKSRSWISIAVLAVVVLYPLSFGPACWIYSRTYSKFHHASSSVFLDTVYYPIIWMQASGPRPVRSMIENYSNWGTARYRIRFHHELRVYEGHIYLWDTGRLKLDVF